MSLSKPTVLKHKAHITDPLTTFVKQAQRDPAIRQVSDDDYLNAVVAAAAKRVGDAPELVTVTEGIKATQARPQKRPNHDILMVIAGWVTDRVDVEHREFEPSEPKRIGIQDDDGSTAA